MTKIIIGSIICIALLTGSIIWYQSTPGKLDTFATCIQESGAKFYGAYWCPHCQRQKNLFGKSKKLIPYTECSLPGGQSQNKICNDAEIKSYPTWEFADGERLTGELSLKVISERTGCPLPA